MTTLCEGIIPPPADGELMDVADLVELIATTAVEPDGVPSGAVDQLRQTLHQLIDRRVAAALAHAAAQAAPRIQT